jgi:hypothetical protein
MTHIEMACLSVAELGFLGGATYDQVIAGALTQGLAACPLERGGHLRLQYMDQPEGSVGFPVTKTRAPSGSITVVSSPRDGLDETPKGFYLRRIEGLLCLRGFWSSLDHLWHQEDFLVFIKTTTMEPASYVPAGGLLL